MTATVGPLHDARQSSIWRSLVRDPRAVGGSIAAFAVILMATIGPAVAPYSITEFVGRPFQKPDATALLGTDVLGHDVLSMLLRGGGSFLLQGVLAASLGVGAGVLLGMVLGLVRYRARSAILFVNDTIMVIPQILVVLIIIASFGATPVTLVLAVGIAQVTYTARLVSAATQRVVHDDYFLAAKASGSGPWRLMTLEILPNIAGPVLVEFGVRLSISFVVLASLSFLGFGQSGAEWGRMIHDNQGGISVQPAATLAPVLAIAVFLIGINLVRDGLARAISARSGR